MKLLPSSLTKSRLWKLYQDSCVTVGQLAVGYSKFCDLWRQLCPFVVIMRPASDLCWTCQKNNNQILRSANLPESKKAEVVKQQEKHLTLAASERDYYKGCCKTTKDALAEHLTTVDFSEKHAPCSLEGTVHYLLTLTSLAQSILRPHGSVVFLESAVKQYRDKCTF